MIRLDRLVDDLFDDEKLSIDNLRAFTEDHMLRLAIPANNPGGVYSGMLTNTSNKYTAYYGKITNEGVESSISEGLTISMENSKTTVFEKLSSLRGLVVYKFGESSSIFQEFYPLGMSEYFDATLAQLPPLLDRFVTAATSHLTADYPADVLDVTAKVTAFKSARSSQLTAFGIVDGLQTGRREARADLTWQLTANFLTLALDHLGKPDELNNYYDPRYLPFSVSDGPINYVGTVGISAIKNVVSSGIFQSTKITLKNTGDTSLEFAVTDSPTSMGTATQNLMPGETVTFLTSTLGPLPAYYLNVQNDSAVAEGAYKVTIE